MNRIAATTLALAITAAGGTAFAAYQDYGNGSYYDSRANNGAPYDSRYNNADPRYANAAYAAASRNDTAQVISVRPMYAGNASYQGQECWNEQTNAYDDGYYRDGAGNLYRGDSNANGTLLGALIGGVLGNQVGSGDGKTAATVGGAVIGGVIGNNIDRSNNAYNNNGAYNNSGNYNNNAYQQYQGNGGTVTRCRTVTNYDNNQNAGGYDVTYRYGGQTYRTITGYHPGRTMRVRVSVTPQNQALAYRR